MSIKPSILCLRLLNFYDQRHLPFSNKDPRHIRSQTRLSSLRGTDGGLIWREKYVDGTLSIRLRYCLSWIKERIPAITHTQEPITQNANDQFRLNRCLDPKMLKPITMKTTEKTTATE